MKLLQRITTEYVDAEDRMRLSGETEDGETVTLWLTRRLLKRLVAHLCDWLEQETGAGDRLHSGLMNGFAQQAAAASLASQPPVRVADGAACSLVDSVDVTAGGNGVRLTFRRAGDESGGLILQPLQLRQWLSILHAQYDKADWPEADWPEWVTENRPVSPTAAPVAVH